MRPQYWICGGGDRSCPHWDDINGCWAGAKHIDDENCLYEEEENLDFEDRYI